MSHTDIKKNGWIDEYIPEEYRAYAYLARLDRPIGAWLLILPAWTAIFLATGGIGGVGGHTVYLFLLFGIGAVVMRAAGCVINDLWDRQLDAQVTRTAQRPIASGDVSVQEAAVFLFILLCIGLFLLSRLTLVPVLLGVLALPLIAIYPFMKRISWWPQLFLGIVFNFSILMGWSAVTATLSLSALALYVAGIFWTLGYDTIYAYQDKEDDLRVGIKSSALKLGDTGRFWVCGFYIAGFLFLFAGFLLAKAGILSLVLLAVPVFLAVRDLQVWNVKDPQNCLDIFRANRDIGFWIVIAALL